jgi:hypothetical protein
MGSMQAGSSLFGSLTFAASKLGGEPVADSFFDRHLVWWSSRESIEAGKTSLLAVAEVIFSVAAYWWIAWYFDTYAHLLISFLVAPLVLLRSDESVALGVEMFNRYSNAEDTAAAHPMSPARGASYWLSTSSGTVKTCPGYMRSGSRINAELALKMTL